MRTRTLAIASSLAAVVVLGAACNPPQPHPMAGQTKYLCCNLRYEKDEVTDNWYQVGTPIKAGTQVSILEVRKRSVKFQAEGHPPITLVFKYGEKIMGFDDYLGRIFLDDNPLRKLGKKRDKLEQAALDGRVEKGMTRDQVIMALGYPAAHRTPSLESDNWGYWRTKWNQYVVWFEKGRVSRVQD